ncbi:MAG: 16S rRNA processing protein RimM [Oscillospiraceae bacterium]|nr:16S rRNA processing protein RimM [Oscillospiraceae bacterium]
MALIYVIKIVNTHGTRGEVKALHYTDGEDFFGAVDTLYSADGSRAYKIDGWKFHKGAVLIKLRGIDDMTAAELLKGEELYAREEDLPPLPEGRYYFFQLTGLKAVLPDGSVLGTVTDVSDGAGGEMLTITREDGKKCLIPKCDAFVKEVSLERDEIYITPIEGLID